MTNWGIRRIALALLAMYIGAGVAITMWPTPVDRPLRAQLNAAIASMHNSGVPAFVDYAFVESFANVLFFLPLGLLLALIVARRFWWIASLTGFAASASVEIAQLVFLPNRFATYEDVAANTAGALIGALLAVGVRFALTRRNVRPIYSPLRTITPIAYSRHAA